MFYIIFGLIILFIPFLLTLLFKDKREGFVYILFSWIFFQTLISIITQALGIFSFWIIFAINLLGAIFVFYYLYKNKLKIKFDRKIDWMLILTILISVLCLLQVHFNYTGKINLSTDQTVFYHDVKNMVYQYPYYSDEWNTVSLINYSIESQKLPFKNPLDNSFFINIAFSFYSFLSGIVLFLKLNPVLSYNFLALIINTVIIVLCYLFLRINNLPKSVSAISAMSLLYITAGANLPGIWHLIPVHMGIIFTLIGFCFISLKKKIMQVLSSIGVILFYPPLFIFYGLALAVSLFKKVFINKKILKIAGFAFLGAIMLGILFFSFSDQKTRDFFISKFFHASFSGNYIQKYAIYDVIPLIAIFFGIVGIFYIAKNMKWLISVLALGILYWIVYSFSLNRFVIDFERVVFFTAIIILLISGFGLSKVLDFLDKKIKTKKYKISLYITVIIILCFILFASDYTTHNNWEKFILVNASNGSISYPKAPANNYLVADDLRLFSGIKGKRFLSIPWKGLVVSVATNNTPIVTKDGTISAGGTKILDNFMNSDCKGKMSLAKNRKIDYIYLYKFECPGFEKIGESDEGFMLYKVK